MSETAIGKCPRCEDERVNFDVHKGAYNDEWMATIECAKCEFQVWDTGGTPNEAIEHAITFWDKETVYLKYIDNLLQLLNKARHVVRLAWLVPIDGFGLPDNTKDRLEKIKNDLDCMSKEVDKLEEEFYA